MFVISRTWNTRELASALEAIGPRQSAFVQSLAINRLAQRTKANERAVLLSRIDRPTPYTQNSLRMQAGNKAKPEARVWFKDRDFGGQKGHPAGDYLMPQVHGGQRKHKALEGAVWRIGELRRGEHLVPTRSAPRDGYGNVPRTLVTRIMSGLRAFNERGYTANATNSKRSRGKGNASKYFVADIDGTRGIWERRQFAAGAGVRAIFVAVDGAPRYRRRFPFHAVAENTIRAHYNREFTSAFEYALRTAR